MAALNGMATHKPSALLEPFLKSLQHSPLSPILLSSTRLLTKTSSNPLKVWAKKRRNWVVESVAEDKQLAPLNTSNEANDPLLEKGSLILEPSSSERGCGGGDDDDDGKENLTSRAINASIVLGFGTLAVSKLLTIDHDYWHGWTLFEILRYAPEHNWVAYEQALKANPVLAKMAISGIVYSIGDWIAQCYEGKPLFDFDRTRMFRSGLVGFTLHGSLSHYYYQFCEALFPFEDWWVVPAKVAFDQTVWAAVWNSIYFVVLGLLRFESSANIYRELKATFWPMLTAGWKLWPFAHLITYGVIPVEQRLLWVDFVELIWVTIFVVIRMRNQKHEYLRRQWNQTLVHQAIFLRNKQIKIMFHSYEKRSGDIMLASQGQKSAALDDLRRKSNQNQNKSTTAYKPLYSSLSGLRNGGLAKYIEPGQIY